MVQRKKLLINGIKDDDDIKIYKKDCIIQS